MVAVVTGSGLGLQNSSSSVLGSAGQLGSSRLGQAGSHVTVNAANGNLVVQSQDEMLIGLGLDAGIVNTYNSQGTLTANDWQESFRRSVGGLTGTVGTSGSTITHFKADGSAIVYTWNAGKSAYVGNEADGAYDTLSFNSGANKWTWTDGATRSTEVYDGANGGRLFSSADADGNLLSYTYTGSLLTRITTANGDYISLNYTGALLTSVATYNSSNSLTGTLVRYGYDGSNRLTSVTVDLSPGDSAIADGKTYVTNYGYDGSSTRIASITQSDGSSLAITYTTFNGKDAVAAVTQATTGSTTSTTTFSYGVNRTTVVDPLGNATTFVYDGNGRLIQLISPEAAPGGALQAQAFSYDSNGNLIYSGPAGDPHFTNIGQNWGESNDPGVTTTQAMELAGDVPAYRRQSTTTPPVNWVMRLGTSRPGMTAVSPGQTVDVSIYAASSRTSQLVLCVNWLDANHNYVGNANLGNIATSGTLGASGVTTANFASKTVRRQREWD